MIYLSGIRCLGGMTSHLRSRVDSQIFFLEKNILRASNSSQELCLFNSAALAFKSSLDAGSPMFSAITTGPCDYVSHETEIDRFIRPFNILDLLDDAVSLPLVPPSPLIPLLPCSSPLPSRL